MSYKRITLDQINLIKKAQHTVRELTKLTDLSEETIRYHAKKEGVLLPKGIRERGTGSIYKVVIGARYGKLVVTNYVHVNRQFLYNCRCDCGKESIRAAKGLHNSKMPSCGCAIKELNKSKRIKPGLAAAHSLFCVYRCNARRKQKEFTIGVDEFVSLISKNCFYCGKEPFNSTQRGNSATPFIYSGVDRIDSTKGYTVENCVPCCKICNVAKNTQTMVEFKNWIELLHKRLEDKQWICTVL